MRTDTPKDMPTHLLQNPEQYITRVGKFLRKTSLDELPQIINILLGHMSVVGPRPALWNQFDLIEERDRYGANDVRPGLTGWAQVNGRNAISWEDKFELDVWYVDHISIGLDIKTIFMTVKNVLKREGISGEGQATMSEFMGSSEETHV
jgi:O-antigen biosynthesis protein WbqP